MAESVPDEVEALISDARTLAHLATCDDGRPHAAPVWYRYEAGAEGEGDDGSGRETENENENENEGGVVELVTTGRKLANLRSNPRVSLSIARERADREGSPEWSVTLLGTATVVDDEAASLAASRRINRKYGVDEDAWAGENTLVRVAVGSASYRTYD
jgi:nitroimidazol reductase NimA-like FMN-containing flavoprotein (pyridoxamine 5'-phosphate oxidase superfamily)